MIRFQEEDIRYLALELPDEIKFYKYSGDFAGECLAIDAYLARRPVSGGLRCRLAIERVIAEELTRDYLISFDALLERLQRDYPACRAENLEEIIRIGNADYVMRDGKRFFQRSAASNILDCNERYLQSLESGILPEGKPGKLLYENMKIMQRDGGRAYHYCIEEHLEPSSKAQFEGKLLRVHLPFPAITPIQSDIRLISSSHPVYLSQRSAHRTAFFEEYYKEGDRYSVKFEYTIRVPYLELDENAVSAEQPSFYLGEQAPQIRFTPAVTALAKDLKGREKNPLILARRAYDWVTKNVVYSYMRHYLCMDNIPEFAMFNGRGDCGVQALLFITLCRAMGVPARWQSGSAVRESRIGSHDWAQFYVAPYGWLWADPSFGGGQRRNGCDELWNHYFGNFDAFREINCTDFQAPFDPPKQFMRCDPYDNQSGEAEYEDYGLGFSETKCGRSVVSFEDIGFGK